MLNTSTLSFVSFFLSHSGVVLLLFWGHFSCHFSSYRFSCKLFSVESFCLAHCLNQSTTTFHSYDVHTLKKTTRYRCSLCCLDHSYSWGASFILALARQPSFALQFTMLTAVFRTCAKSLGIFSIFSSFARFKFDLRRLLFLSEGEFFCHLKTPLESL